MARLECTQNLIERPVLKLNADYIPICTISAREALTLVFRELVYIAEAYAEKIMDSAGRLYDLPRVVVLREYNKYLNGPATFCKQNLLIRDDYSCGYCGTRLSRGTATLDHIIPRSRGGKTTWDNTTIACGDCNTYKADKLLEECSLSLTRRVYTPTKREILARLYEEKKW